MSADDQEQWKPVPGYEGYYDVSDQGRVMSLARIDASGNRRKPRILRPRPDRRGYLMVDLYRGGVQRTHKVHRLVLTAFTGPCPDGMEACHGDDRPDNNRLTNLRWDTSGGNAADRSRNRRPRTECSKGHLLAGENLYLTPDRRRECRACKRGARRESHPGKRAA